MSKEMETKIEEIKSAVITGKESTDAEVKTLKDTIVELQDEVAELKTGVKAMPQDNKEKVNAVKDQFWAVARKGYTEAGHAVEELIGEKGMTVVDDTSAGAGIVEELANTILVPAQEDYAITADMGKVTVSSTDYSVLVQVGRSTAVWGSENTSNTAPGQTSTPTFAKVSAKFAKLTIDNFITNESLKDPKYDMEAFLTNDARVQAGRQMAQGVIDGDGTGDNPKGLLAHFDVVESAKDDETRGKQHFGEIEVAGGSLPADDQALIEVLRELELSLRTPYLAKAKFYVNRAVYKRLAAMKDANNQYYLQKDLSGKSKGTLFGYPVMVEAFLQDDQTVGNRPIIFGDLSLGFKLINHVGLSVLRNPYIVPGNVNFHWEMRVGTIIGDSLAVKAVRIAA